MKTIFTSKKKWKGLHNPFLFMVLLLFIQEYTLAQQKYTIEASNTIFTPDVLTIQAGDTVEWHNVQGYHNVNGTQDAYPINPESFGNEPSSSAWIYNHVFTTMGNYDYHCDPHLELGMTGEIIVLDSMGYMLTMSFSNMDPHVGQMLYLAVIDKETGMEITRTMDTVAANFNLSVTGLEMSHSYYVNFFVDFNENGMYDTPPTDHAWQMELDDVMGDTTLLFTHNTDFTDIMWMNKLTVMFMSMTPHAGQNLWLGVIDKSTGEEIASTNVTVAESFDIELFGIENGTSYNVDFYADFNENNQYDAPPTDHAWRMELNNVMGDTTLMFTHNTDFTDIFLPTAINERFLADTKVYPNPANERVIIEFSKRINSTPEITIYDLTGRIEHKTIRTSANYIDLNVQKLTKGMYIVEVKTNTDKKVFKLLKE